jgi:hypothetical protein
MVLNLIEIIENNRAGLKLPPKISRIGRGLRN